MTIQINQIEDTALVSVRVNDDCNHAGYHYDTIEHYAGTFNDGNVYPDYYEEEVKVCTACGMYYDQIMGYWEVK